MVPSQIERLLKISNNYPLLSHTKIPPIHNIFLYININIYIYIYIYQLMNIIIGDVLLTFYRLDSSDIIISFLELFDY